MQIYIYLVSLILNCISIYRKNKEGLCYLLFLLFKNIVIIIFLNIIFIKICEEFNVGYISYEIVLIFFCCSMIMYIFFRRYICLCFGGILSYIIFKSFNFDFDINNLIFLIGSLHICEGIFVSLIINGSKDKIYLPLSLGDVYLIFLIFYRRRENFNLKLRNLISGNFIILYGFIVLKFLRLENDLITLILIAIIHELLIYVEKCFIRIYYVFK